MKKLLLATSCALLSTSILATTNFDSKVGVVIYPGHVGGGTSGYVGNDIFAISKNLVTLMRNANLKLGSVFVNIINTGASGTTATTVVRSLGVLPTNTSACQVRGDWNNTNPSLSSYAGLYSQCFDAGYDSVYNTMFTVAPTQPINYIGMISGNQPVKPLPTVETIITALNNHVPYEPHNLYSNNRYISAVMLDYEGADGSQTTQTHINNLASTITAINTQVINANKKPMPVVFYVKPSVWGSTTNLSSMLKPLTTAVQKANAANPNTPTYAYVPIYNGKNYTPGHGNTSNVITALHKAKIPFKIAIDVTGTYTPTTCTQLTNIKEAAPNEFIGLIYYQWAMTKDTTASIVSPMPVTTYISEISSCMSSLQRISQ